MGRVTDELQADAARAKEFPRVPPLLVDQWDDEARSALAAGFPASVVQTEAATATDWAPLERDLLIATDQMLEQYVVDDETWARLAEQLDERQLIEMLFVVGTYAGLAMAFNSFNCNSTRVLRPRSPRHG
jgi:hypothetical protein